MGYEHWKLEGNAVVASISGGKDSAALSLWLTEQGIEHTRVFQDTGWEHPAVLEYLRGPLAAAIGPIVEIRGPETMRELIIRKGMFPSRKRRFCTEELKIFPMRAYLAEHFPDGDVVNAVGIRREESQARATASEWEHSKVFDCDVWRPLVEWTMQDVVDIHKRHNLAPNPLYLWGAERVGCWPCINSRKSEIKLLADRDPARITEIAEIETIVSDSARARWERDRAAELENPTPEPTDPDLRKAWRKRYKRLFVQPFTPPAYFQAKLMDNDGNFPCWPIAKVVDWAKTARGGRQAMFELFDADPWEAGCARWGLCEQPRADAMAGSNT